LPPVVRELQSTGRPEEGREQERGQKDSIHRAFIALLRLPPEHDERAPARRVPVYPLSHVRARRRGGGDLRSASRPGYKGPDAEQEDGDHYERRAADEPPRQRKPHDPCIVNHARAHPTPAGKRVLRLELSSADFPDVRISNGKHSALGNAPPELRTMLRS
jgi:hypothetical protein